MAIICSVCRFHKADDLGFVPSATVPGSDLVASGLNNVNRNKIDKQSMDLSRIPSILGSFLTLMDNRILPPRMSSAPGSPDYTVLVTMPHNTSTWLNCYNCLRNSCCNNLSCSYSCSLSLFRSYGLRYPQLSSNVTDGLRDSISYDNKLYDSWFT